MPKNILIFSDGTGQVGGLRPDETRSNVYKLYHATRVGPDTAINPSQQLAFYDAGLGTGTKGAGFRFRWWRRLYNLLSKATGLGITHNIIDCYAAILQLWEPGDRIFLFGFSRGAYTVRCLSGVLKLCGVPTDRPDGPFRRDPASVTALATEAVKTVYQFGSSIRGNPYKADRQALATNFRRKYQSADAPPYFIGIWDTVASLGVSPIRIVGLLLLLGSLVALFAGLVDFGLKNAIFVVQPQIALFWRVFWSSVALLALAGLGAYFVTHLKYARGIGRPWWQTLHLTGFWMQIYDTELSSAVEFARHALSIDENRKDFQRVPWTMDGNETPVGQPRSEGPIRLAQIWFAGEHSDVGGGFAENESRLSDIALGWMIEQATELHHPLLVDRSGLKLWPSAIGMQHDARKEAIAAMPRWFVRLALTFMSPDRLGWPAQDRQVPVDAPLHPSVKERFASGRVLAYDVMVSYLPKPLCNHRDVNHYYKTNDGSAPAAPPTT